jgi:2-aminoethylphosphonate transport system substrate-binding protein
MRTIFAAALALAAFAAPASAQSGVVTVYSADGLHDGKGSWYETQYAASLHSPRRGRRPVTEF